MCACCLPCSCRIERWRLQCSVSLLPHDYFGSRGCSETFYCIKPGSNTVLSWAGKLGNQKMEVQWHQVSNACRTTVMNGAVNCCWCCFMHFLIPAYLTAPALLNNACLFCAHAGTCTRESTQVAIIFTPSSTKFPVKEEINFDYSLIFTLPTSFQGTVWLGVLESLTAAWPSSVPTNHPTIKLKAWRFWKALSLQCHKKKCRYPKLFREYTYIHIYMHMYMRKRAHTFCLH